ncbi:MAG: tRNA (adenosine(37)-N6)-threonylcarbamoyltransferase complex dimerization subunit type 1 TsaB [Chthoniobacterales bacterium]
MNRLVIESSTAQASVALFSGSELLVEEVFPSGRGPVSQFFSILERTLKLVDQLDELVVGVGPGSYSGIRIGISAAIGLQLAREIPAMGIVSLLGFEGDNYQVVLDARGSSTFAKVANGMLVAAPENCTREEMLEKIDSSWITFSPDEIGDLSLTKSFPLASMLGKRVLAGGVIPLPLQPLYLKKPHITAAKTIPLF